MQNKDCKVRILRTVIGITMLVLLLASGGGAVSSQSGNRVWDGSKNMDTTYTWNSYSFAGFYYNLDDNLSTEELTISNIKRTIDEGDISYKTNPIEISFDYSPFGKYQVIGFMADKYFAGYTVNSVISGNKAISTIGSGQLQRVLFDDENKRTVYEGGSLTLGGGYVLKIKEVDIGAGPRQVLVALLKDGAQVDSSVVEAGNTYIYSTRVGGVSDLPVIAVHVDSVFRGTEANAAFIKGVFQISDIYTPVHGGDRYGIMEITGADENQITMKNRDSIDLSPGNTADLMGNLKIIVADNSSVLRFAPTVGKIGAFDIRGTIYPATNEWTPLNFGLNIGSTSMGFYYDMDKDIGTEDLKTEEVSGTSIPETKLVYSTSPQEISFGYSPFGTYQVIGFMADKYFAGYTAKNIISGNKSISTIGSSQLQKVLLDDDNRRVISEGGTLTLQEGYVLKVKEVDIGVAPGQVWIVLLKDGVEIDNSTVAGGNTYIYTTKVGSVSDLPIIAVHFESVFRGTEVNAAFTRGIFQISSAITTVRSNDRYGQMEVRTIGAGGIKMDNPDSIDLSRGSTVDVMGNIKFKVADSSEVRFYPFVMVQPGTVANQLVIEAPAKVTAGSNVTIKVTAGGNAIEGVSVTIDSGTGMTDINGVLNYTLPKTMTGIHNITAAKLGYQNAIKSIDVQGYIENRLSIDAPSAANQFETIPILVTYNGTAVSGANVTYDNVTIGSTGSNGMLNYTLNASGTHTISASKSGYVTASRDIEVRVPFSEFKALDINITPGVVTANQSTVIRSNITNAGTKQDTLPVALIINSTEVDNRSVTLAPGEVKEVGFTYKAVLPAGNYSVEILGQKGQLEVKPEVKPTPKIPFGGAVIATVAILFIYLMVKRQKNKRQ